MANLLKIGGIGCVIWLVALIVAIVGGLMTVAVIMGSLGGGASSQTAMMAALATLVMVLAIGMLLVAIGALLVSVGAFGLQKKYQTPIAGIAGIFGLIYAIAGFVNIGILAVGGAGLLSGMMPGARAVSDLAATYFTVGLVGTVMGILFTVLLGVTFIVKRTAMGHGSLPLITGIFLILFIIPIVNIVTIILLMVMFSKLAKEGTAVAAPAPAPTPQVQAPQVQYPCLKCGTPLTYIQAYQKWYCYNCQRYHE